MNDKKVDIIMVLDYLDDLLVAMAREKLLIPQDDKDWLDGIRMKWSEM